MRLSFYRGGLPTYLKFSEGYRQLLGQHSLMVLDRNAALQGPGHKVLSAR
jgi:hypothetical protein